MLAATPFLQVYANWCLGRLEMVSAAAAQEAELLRLVQRARRTRFGCDHEFSEIRSVADFQARVPIRDYEAFWEEYWGDAFPRLVDCTWPGQIPYFARTSGTTTGVTKFVPVSQEMNWSNIQAGWLIIALHLRNRPMSQILGGRFFMLGGSTDLKREAPGVFSGDLSGIEANEIPWWGRPYAFPPLEVALLKDWEEKIDRLARLSLREDIRVLGGVPSWLLIYFDKLAELRPELEPKIATHFPHLEMLIHGGVDFRPYARRFSELLEGSRAELREVYPASEGFIAIADRGQGEGLRLLTNNGIFFEFVPTSELGSPAPSRHWVATIETGIDYAVIVSTCAGAWAYVLGDTVRFVETDPPRLLITGRTTSVLSAFGEHLIVEEIEEAVATAADRIELSVVDYSVTPEFPDVAGQAGRHRYFIEFAERRPNDEQIEDFAQALDQRLCVLNADYADHRSGGIGLGPPMVMALEPGTFAGWMKRRGRLGGQNKVPRVMNKSELVADLNGYMRDISLGADNRG